MIKEKIKEIKEIKTKKNWKPTKPVVLLETNVSFFFICIEELKKIKIDVNKPKISEKYPNCEIINLFS